MGSAATPQELTGILVALVTPFAEDGSISEERLGSHINRLIDAGVHGLVPGGTTAEFTALSPAERKQNLELVIKYAKGRVPVVAGIGALYTSEAEDYAVHAAKAGAAAIMALPPFYDAPNLDQLKEFMGAIHKAANLPIVYYNIPSATGVNLTPAELASLSDYGVTYLKDTSGNAPAFTELLFGHADKITAFNGWDTLTFYGIAAGAKGGVWGAANVIPDLAVELWNTVAVKKDLVKGRELWEKIWPICAFLEEFNYPSAVKTALELQGIQTGGLRKPFALLKGEPRTRLVGLLNSAGLKTVE
ncbi:aldolase [Aaosphaeria arxii CBS 175.79]|uniref:Aldolase n=1 Tax=Aaosphaeria arxii CBS 175.79 TaxID=1450172 RepID=A0A6A5X9T2_9PLEO|nr:aldolase [Aaosphaeria arxii CBS 175.79]KAF2009728.1 aldolase [Aaosphaeria arxii CBS 175.79]